MNMKLFKGYVLATIAVLILAMAAFVLLNNIGGEWKLHVVWKPVTMRPVAGMLVMGIAGAIVWWTMRRLLPRAITTLREGGRARQARKQTQQLKELGQEREAKPEP